MQSLIAAICYFYTRQLWHWTQFERTVICSTSSCYCSL